MAAFKIPPGNWNVYYSLNLSMFACSTLGTYYVKRMKSDVGVLIPFALFLSKKGHTSCYFRQEDRKVFGEHAINLYIQKSAKEFCKKLDMMTDSIKKEMAMLLACPKISSKQILDFIASYQTYTGTYTIPRNIIDFISPEKIPLVLDDLKASRLRAETVHQVGDTIFQKFFLPIAIDAKIPIEHLLCITYEELEEYISKGVLPSSDMLRMRYEGCVFSYSAKGVTVSTLPNDISSVELIGVTKKDVPEISGRVAHQGFAKGIVRLVLDPSSQKTFNKGDILVTGMTRPEFVPLMEKAGAIVTDGGGLLCHAAIVARELGKPCIIGTQIATKILKDGDSVEVDAVKGIVRKLNT